MAYSKSGFASQLGISGDELKRRARDAGFGTTEEFYNATGGTGKMPKSADDIYKEQMATSKEFLNRFQSSAGDIYNRLAQEQGLGGAMQRATQAMETYEDIPGQEKTVAKQVGISAPRLERRIAGRQAEMAPIAQRALQQAQTAQGLVESGYQRGIQPYVMEASMISDNLARQMTGYTTEAQSRLSMNLQKLQNQGMLDAAELQQTIDLANSENQFEVWKKQLDYSQKYKSNVGSNNDANYEEEANKYVDFGSYNMSLPDGGYYNSITGNRTN